ncbi:hypothetical protein [Lachnobacterium bovis]|uniref:Uncharacterized protein n=1 Tax=Lachnobacterium bovis TaxID=140626 RepID=A0A1H9P6G3_9FIRM|nr:hypothetical protein [Lachnobacterium bovis]SER43687.1 hypothetical protein SAMN02910429_00109 [Lachnobacterium bovis]
MNESGLIMFMGFIFVLVIIAAVIAVVSAVTASVAAYVDEAESEEDE